MRSYYLDEPEVEPLSLATVRLHCRVDDDRFDALFSGVLIPGARRRLEQRTGYATVQRLGVLVLDDFPSDDDGVIELPYAPAVSVVSVSYQDADGTDQTVDADDYTVDTAGRPGRIAPVSGWPATNGGLGNVQIRFLAGLGNPGSPPEAESAEQDIPGELKSWMLLRISTYLNQADALQNGQINAMPDDWVDGLLDGYRVNRGFA